MVACRMLAIEATGASAQLARQDHGVASSCVACSVHSQTRINSKEIPEDLCQFEAPSWQVHEKSNAMCTTPA